MECVKCGCNIDNNEKYCKYCGSGVGEQKTIIITDEPKFLLFLLVGLVLPAIGVFAYFLLRKTSPKQAKAFGVGALTSLMFFACFAILHGFVTNSFGVVFSMI